jgi:hypothetical protein
MQNKNYMFFKVYISRGRLHCYRGAVILLPSAGLGHMKVSWIALANLFLGGGPVVSERTFNSNYMAQFL